MNDELYNAIVTYHHAAVETLARTSRRSIGTSLEVISNPRFEFPPLVDALESQEPFRTLVKRTKAAFQTDALGLWDDRARNFFRRTGFYNKAYRGEAPVSDDLVRSYLNAFERRVIERTYLAPIECVKFHKESLDLGSFQIQRFSAKEIDTRFQNDINRIFFTSSVADASRLTDYWFLSKKETIPLSDLLRASLPGPEVVIRYTPFPPALERVLQQLALFYWPSWDLEAGYDDGDPWKDWFQINVPFVLVLDDNLLSAPRSIPDLSALETEVSTETGKRVRVSGPQVGIDMTIGTPTGCLGDWFEEFMIETGSLIEKVRPHFATWRFLERALEFLGKAFLTEGHEQLLWHVTTLESLFGEGGAGVTGRLAGRIGAVLGEDATEQASIARQFEDLYRFRCDLVHGRGLTSPMFRRHLREARELARRASRWFLNFANMALDEFGANNLPTREEMLRAIDLTIQGSSRLNRLISTLPNGFPNVSDWTNDWPDEWPDVPRSQEGSVSADLQAFLEQYKNNPPEDEDN